MREVKIIQSDDGAISIETAGEDGNPITTGAKSLEEAIEQIKGQFGATPTPEGVEESMTEEPKPVDETGPVAAKKGGKMEENIPMVDKEKRGAQARKQADWSDYSL